MSNFPIKLSANAQGTAFSLPSTAWQSLSPPTTILKLVELSSLVWIDEHPHALQIS